MRQIAALFLFEATAYALLGGVLGVLLGSGMIGLFGYIVGLRAMADIPTAMAVVLIAALVGIIFGVVPALKAANLQPVEALQQE